MSSAIDGFSSRLTKLETDSTQSNRELKRQIASLVREIKLFSDNPKRTLTENEMFTCQAMIIRSEVMIDDLNFAMTLERIQAEFSKRLRSSIT